MVARGLCRSQVDDMGGFEETIAYARAKGWHFYSGGTQGGRYIDVRLCPLCVGTPRSHLPPAPDYIAGQLELELELEVSNEGEKGSPPTA